MTDRKKPLGLTLIAIYSAFTALLLMPAGCAVTLFSQAPGAGGLIAVVGYLSTLLGFLSCATVYGLWTLQEWGRSLAYWLYLASIPLGVAAIFPPLAGPRMTAGNTVLQMIGIAVDLFIIVYLTRPDVTALFVGVKSDEVVPVAGRQEPS